MTTTTSTASKVPATDAPWSAAYREDEDAFAEFASHVPPDPLASSGGAQRQPSARQLSGQFEEESEKQWQADWDDEDQEDSYDRVLEQINLERSKGSDASKSA